MMMYGFLRKTISRHFTKQKEIIFRRNIPSHNSLFSKFSEINELGLYLHIPFCAHICPYCPYNKQIFKEETCREYVCAVIKEINYYIPVLKNKPVTSFYIGGGTPTTMLGKGIETIINHIYKHLNMKCYVHMESHPNDLSAENLGIIESLGVKYLSIGVEALQDRHLKAIERPYTVRDVKNSIGRAVGRNFRCVNIDFIFDLPQQTDSEIEQAGKEIIKMGVHQAATYPLFNFSYTPLGKELSNTGNVTGTMIRRRRQLKILENIFYDSDYYRSSVWAFTKNGTDKYCSVTVPLYLGLGASGSSYLKDIFYVNTFNVSEYIRANNEMRTPIALSVELTDEMQMAGWLYWRIYETRFRKSDFEHRFNKCFDEKYGLQMKILSRIGYLQNGRDQISLTDKGAYWLHAFEDFFSINYINKLWGSSKFDPWPEKLVL